MIKFKLPTMGINLLALNTQAENNLQEPQKTGTEVRCWNCGEYTDRYAERCEHCGDAPNPYVDSFPRGDRQN